MSGIRSNLPKKRDSNWAIARAIILFAFVGIVLLGGFAGYGIYALFLR